MDYFINQTVCVSEISAVITFFESVLTINYAAVFVIRILFRMTLKYHSTILYNHHRSCRGR